MPGYFWDTSALVKHYHPELGTAKVDALLQVPGLQQVLSRLGVTETFSVSLAVSLYQMLCGRLPFQGESMAQLMFKIANEPPTDILSIRPDVPRALVDFLARALAKNPDERFQTGEEFGGALRATLGAATQTKVDIQL